MVVLAEESARLLVLLARLPFYPLSQAQQKEWLVVCP